MADLPSRITTQLRVLVVEGSPVGRQMLAREVEAMGHEVHAVRDLDEAWFDVSRHDADAVLVDWPVADDGGLEFCRRVRAREAEADRGYAWLVMSTSPSGHQDVAAALEAGADAFLVKPIDSVALRASLVAAGRFVRLHADARAERADVTRLEELLRDEARRDPLTRLGNRVRLNEDLRRIRAGVHRYGRRWVAVMIDVDHLRRYNECLGRHAGDDVLRRVARTVRKALRDDDHAYRYGGQQLLLLLPEQDEDGGVIVAHRCRAAVAALGIPHPRSDASDAVTISAGVAELEGSTAQAVDQWLQRAELALDAAKAAGRNGVVRGGHTRLAGAGPGG